MYGSCLPSRNLKPAVRRHVEVDDRAEFLLSHDAHRHEDGRDQDQENRRDTRHDGIDALEARVVEVARLDRAMALQRLGAGRGVGVPSGEKLIHTGDVLLDGRRNGLAPSTTAETSGLASRLKLRPNSIGISIASEMSFARNLCSSSRWLRSWCAAGGTRADSRTRRGTPGSPESGRGPGRPGGCSRRQS